MKSIRKNQQLTDLGRSQSILNQTFFKIKISSGRNTSHTILEGGSQDEFEGGEGGFSFKDFFRPIMCCCASTNPKPIAGNKPIKRTQLPPLESLKKSSPTRVASPGAKLEIRDKNQTTIKDVKNKQGSALKFALESNKKTMGTAVSKQPGEPKIKTQNIIDPTINNDEQVKKKTVGSALLQNGVILEEPEDEKRKQVKNRVHSI